MTHPDTKLLSDIEAAKKRMLDENEKYQIKFYGEMSIRKYRKMPTRKLKQFWRNVEWASYVDTIRMGW